MYLQLLSCGSSIIVVFNIVLKPGKRPWERGFVVKEFGDVGLCQVFNLMSKEHRSTRRKTMASEKRKNQKQTQPGFIGTGPESSPGKANALTTAPSPKWLYSLWYN